ncbi:MAG: ABC transporter permease [Melioribacteraceae bacterium]|nr:ABC transporter permease [Melioribacteraceae bacterium]
MTSLFNIIKREFKRISERKTLYLMLIIIPVIIFFIYGLIYKDEIIREIPTAILDEDNSSLSHKIIQQIESSSSLRIVKYSFDMNELKEDFLDGKIKAAFYFPKNFEKDIKAGKNSTIVVYKNSSNLILSNLILKDASTIIKTISASILLKKIRSKGNSFSKSFDLINPIKIEMAVIYNPNYSYSNYLVPALIGFTFQLLIMVATVLVFSSEFSHDTFDELIEISKGNKIVIILGKLIPHFLINYSTIFLIMVIIFPTFNINIYSSNWEFVLIYSIFVLASITIAFAISSLIHDQQFATEVAVFFNTPSFIFSGFTFPLWAMPKVHTYFAQLMPFTHFISASIKVMYLKNSFGSAKTEILTLLSFVFISLLINFISISYHLNKIDNTVKN